MKNGQAMTEESYVSFDTAKMLKEAGFREQTKTHYSNSGQVWETALPADYNDDFNCNTCNRPTQALAARWLREAHRIVVDVAFIPPSTDGDVWQCFVGEMDGMVWLGDYEPSERKYPTYEEALEAGIQKAIELAKKQ